jgi:hypothetical protein
MLSSDMDTHLNPVGMKDHQGPDAGSWQAHDGAGNMQHPGGQST